MHGQQNIKFMLLALSKDGAKGSVFTYTNIVTLRGYV
jgi:hypothetical protein